MPLHQNPLTDLTLPLHHPPLCFALYNSPYSKGKFPETSVPLFMTFSRRHLPVVSNKQGFIFRLQTGEPFFHETQHVAYSGKQVAVWQWKRVSQCFCHLNKSAKLDTSTSMWKADTNRRNSHLLHFPEWLHWTCQVDCAQTICTHTRRVENLYSAVQG